MLSAYVGVVGGYYLALLREYELLQHFWNAV